MSLFFLQLRGELRKMFARKRTWIGFGAFLLIEIMVLLLLQLPLAQRAFRRTIESSGYLFAKYNSGLTLGFSILFWTVFLLASLYLSLVAGDVMSKEVEEGTMRMMLCRPVSRLRIIALKYVACGIYTFALIEFIGITALLAGFLRQGFGGGLFVFVPPEKLFVLFDFWPGLGHYLFALQALSLSLVTVTSFAFMLSCCNMKPAAATVVSLSYILIDMIFRSMPYFESIHGWLLTTHMATWYNAFHTPVPWANMLEDYGYLLGADGTLVTIGAVIFMRRDLKS